VRAPLAALIAVLLLAGTAQARPPAVDRSGDPLLSPTFQKALSFATTLHNHQVRKDTSIPYVSHLLQVSGLVLENGGTEKEAIAALLHDAVEDQGGARTLRRIERGFGRDVAKIVSEVTEVEGPWRLRKETKIQRIAAGELSSSALLVKLADNLHNARSMVVGSRAEGPKFWSRFNAGKSDILWYYRGMLKAYRKAGVQSPLRAELAKTVRQLAR
jgi:(p)ppGpp synthase/HD superfamily hydrolase